MIYNNINTNLAGDCYKCLEEGVWEIGLISENPGLDNIQSRMMIIWRTSETFNTKINYIFSYYKNVSIQSMNHREIAKKYSELINKAENANGRKEVVRLFQKAAKLKSKIEIT